ncbi:tyrosine-type recombinase/integrase [Woeseia oceani]|uniref:Integrase n=1 Tax=Woeseia oceani TaxID=1548547 RepID=A0A193LID1_9GAMM|nr:site-specific integrase [Woeseia oceani]ANO52149.1 integrase [Woeseia oceani]
MGRRKTPGLVNRGGVWHIDKSVRGQRLCESTGECNLEKAEEYLARRIEETRKALIYGERPKHTFRKAASKYLNENQHKKRIADEALHLKQLDPFIGDLELRAIHIGTLQPFIEMRQKAGIKSKSINLALGVVRHILNVASSEWLDATGLTWHEHPPKIKLLKVTDARRPYPLSCDEQTRLFRKLPGHLARMALFKVNTGCREQEVCSLRWEWEIEVPELDTSVFLIPEEKVKNGEERLVVLNRVARSVVESVRGEHDTYVFTYCGRRLKRMNNSAWRRARNKAGLPQVRVHDMKHTLGRRLRAAGVSFEDRQDLLGHKSGRITSHYSAAELGNLIEAANKVAGQGSRNSPALVVLKKKAASA